MKVRPASRPAIFENEEEMKGASLKIAGNWKEIVRAFLKLGATAYGGPAIMGIMQTELQEKRQWVSKERFVEGLALVNMLPGPGAIQLGIFLVMHGAVVGAACSPDCVSCCRRSSSCLRSQWDTPPMEQLPFSRERFMD